MGFPLKFVVDTTVLSELQTAGLVAEFFRLGWHLASPNLVLGELEKEWPSLPPVLHGYGLIGVVMEYADIQAAEVKYPETGLSVADRCCIWLAESQATGLLCSDRRMRETAEQHDHIVHGSLWVLDEMVRLKVIDEARACAALKALDGDPLVFLPKAEVEGRLKKWCSKTVR